MQLPVTHVRVDLRGEARPIDRRIYGHFLEEIGRLVDGGLFPEEGSAAETVGIGYRRDVWEAGRDLDPVLLRWPGGCYADVYHWREFVGRDRPVRPPNRYWGHRLGPRWGPPVHEELGTAEFLALCRDWSAEPYICANLGSGTPDEAAEWVAYVNGGSGSLPRCELWSIGNEQFGIWEVGHRTARGYARRYLEFRERMRAADPHIRTVVNGAGTEDPGWNRKVLETVGDAADLLSIHLYPPQDYRLRYLALRPPADTLREWYAALSVDHTVLDKLESIELECRRVLGRALPLAVDEWNLWWHVRQPIQPCTTLRDSLAAALVLMSFQRRADLVRVANLSSLVNLLASPILTDRDRASRTSLFHVFRLFTRHGGSHWVRSTVQGPEYASARVRGLKPTRGTPLVAASATRSLDGSRSALFLLNRHHEVPLRVEVDYLGASPAADAELSWVSGPTRTCENLPGAPERIERGTRTIDRRRAQEIELPPRSLAVLVQELDGTTVVSRPSRPSAP